MCKKLISKLLNLQCWSRFLGLLLWYSEYFANALPSCCQKEPPEVFYKKSCSKKFRSIHRKTPVLEVLFSCRPRLGTLLKKRLQHRCFPVNFARFLGTPILKNVSERLLLCCIKIHQASLECMIESWELIELKETWGKSINYLIKSINK